MTPSTGKEAHARRFGRFLIVGLINTGFGYAVYALLLWLGLPPQPALVLAFAIGVAWNYMTTARFVFRATGFRKVPAYVLAYVAVYLTNAAALQAALSYGTNPFLAQALLTPFFAVMAYVLLSWVFRDTSSAA